jgi:hypothetical protein
MGLRQWDRQRRFSGAVGAAVLVYAVVVAFDSSAALGLDPGRADMPMAGMKKNTVDRRLRSGSDQMDE